MLVTEAGASSELLAKLLDASAAEPGAVRVEVELCGPGQQARLLRSGRADVALLHRPYGDTTGPDTEVLATEEQVAVLPAGHPLTSRTELGLPELGDVPDLPQPRWPGADGSYAEGPGPEVRDHTQLLPLVSLGRMLMVVPDSVRSHLLEGVVAVRRRRAAGHPPWSPGRHPAGRAPWPGSCRRRCASDRPGGRPGRRQPVRGADHTDRVVSAVRWRGPPGVATSDRRRDAP